MIKILEIVTVEYAYNGITAVIRNYMNHMDQQGLIVDYVLINVPEPELRIEIEKHGGKIFVLNRNDVKSYVPALARLCRRERYNVAHVHCNSATASVDLLGLLLGGVRRRIVHSHNTTCSHMKAHKLMYPFFRKSYTQAIACGQKAGEWLFRNRPFLTLKNGIDLERYAFREDERVKTRAELGVTDNTILLGHVGLFNEQKNQAFLIPVMKELSRRGDYRLLLVGIGDLQEKVRRFASESGMDDRIIFLGETKEVERYLQAMDVLVMPSLHEGFPVSLVEAQAAGLSCVISDVISREVDMTGLVRFVSLTESPVAWADSIEEIPKKCGRQELSTDAVLKLKECGYDIRASAEILRGVFVGGNYGQATQN
ncbi:MAG: glycosyltransferase family 1 protein [Acetatifactor sp.]|nr:glycosyltransferase family 1 protein [Acetatifactor sp.]